MPSRKERLFEEIDVHYQYGSQDLQTDCIRLSRTEDGVIALYFWGRGDPGVAELTQEAALELLNHLEVATDMNRMLDE